MLASLGLCLSRSCSAPSLPRWPLLHALFLRVSLSVSLSASLPLRHTGTLGLSSHTCSDLLSGGSSPFQIGLVVILVSTVVAMSAVTQLWEDEWEVLLISLQVSWGAAASSPKPSKQKQCLFTTPVSSDQGPEGAGEGAMVQSPWIPSFLQEDRVACPLDRDGPSAWW